MSRYDVLIIGGGHNGLAAATVLAQAGRKVAVVEKESTVGGLAAGHEFHPGFFSPGMHHDTTQLRDFVVEALHLEQHGLKRSPVNSWVTDTQGNALSMENGLSPEDQRGLEEWRSFLDKARSLLSDMLTAAPVDVIKAAGGDWMPLMKPGLKFRRMGGDFMMELFRVPPMCAADWVSEYVADERARAFLAYDGVIRSFTGPWSPGTAADLLLHAALRGPAVTGGPRALAKVFESAAKAAGATLLTQSTAREILVKNGRACGLQTVDGTSLESKAVLATCDPRHTLHHLLDSAHVPYRIKHAITHFRGEGIGAKIHLAVKGAVRWKNIPAGQGEHVRVMDSLDHLEQSFDPVKYGAFSSRPALDVLVPSLSDSTCAPADSSVVSVWVHGAPYALKGGWTEESKNSLAQGVLTMLDGVTEGLSSQVAAREVLTPVDLEARFNAYHGHMFHGDHALDQLLIRPIPECTQYATYLPGLYLGGSGSFPGGGLTGAPGVLSARAILAQ